ncbi:DMT family transporter [Falsirhodobacter halotolerans]|uniref:DMT family transporter n=1 Tax=Falsirhodobacter halotolerans TaxID=1146892 RepID=UPI001FCF9A67|nr:DMT family transporter [Falsirhodobacter halotolerans]MCJ8138457.1 DMT family transporter [Falsirhodobacter halotolerans]
MDGRHNLRAALTALGAFLIYSTHDTVVKFLGGSYNPMQIVFFSVCFGMPMVTIMLMRDRTDGNLIPRHPWWTLTRTIAAVVAGVTAFYAFTVLPLAQTYAILFATPLLITLLAIPVLGERVGIHRGGAIVAGLIGVMIVIQPGSADLTLGHLAALISAIAGSLSSIIVRKIGREERSVVLLVYPMMANFILMACALPFVYVPMPLAHLGLIGVMSICAFAAMLLTIGAYRMGEAVIVAPMQYSQIIWAALFGFLFFDEGVQTTTLLGAAVIIASGLYIVLREDNVSSTKPVLRSRWRPEGVMPRPGIVMRWQKQQRP